jgi:hypothetical protein
MANGDNLVLGELQNSATSMTRLVGRVDDNYMFRVDQESTVAGAGAIMRCGVIVANAVLGGLHHRYARI